MNTRSRRLSSLLCALLATLQLAGCASDQTPVPPLLAGVTAGSGWASACPPATAAERQIRERALNERIAIAPALERRLQQEFPAGTSNDRITDALRAQGFKLTTPCEADTTIQRATYFHKGTGIIPTDTNATVYWKLDAQRNVVWATGIVTYTGL